MSLRVLPICVNRHFIIILHANLATSGCPASFTIALGVDARKAYKNARPTGIQFFLHRRMHFLSWSWYHCERFDVAIVWGFAESNGYRSNGARQILSPFRDNIPPERVWMRRLTLPGQWP
jgi:hypothetical protein